ncbi:Tex-like N-terminal domain-containing protein, partial [Paenibacillus xylanexedens]|uniref:Tex-like N-terminal domain-containing protein n=1 Tax=Paenibacillus xylanexedens TaxID=528191 RepID=UPI0011A22366
KEMSGELDENQVGWIEEGIVYVGKVEDGKLEVMGIIEEEGKVRGEVEKWITEGVKVEEVEEVYGG